jgi:hypothetical protein
MQCTAGMWLCPPGTHPMVPVVDAGATDARSDGAAPGACAAADQLFCYPGTRGGPCGQFPLVSQCTDGQWNCSDGAILPMHCGCIGQVRPGCACSDGGLVCPDAGTD